MKKEIYKDLFLDALTEAAYFPLWWYSQGFKKIVLFSLKQIKFGWQVLGIGILLANFFKAMYGQRDWASYFLSITTRLVRLVVVVILMVLWLGLWLAILIIWLILPPFIIWKIIIS